MLNLCLFFKLLAKKYKLFLYILRFENIGLDQFSWKTYKMIVEKDFQLIFQNMRLLLGDPSYRIISHTEQKCGIFCNDF